MDEKAVAALTLRKALPEGVLRDIVRQKGTLSGILGRSFEELVHSGFDLKSAGIIAETNTSKAEGWLKRLDKAGGRLLLLEDDDYPSILKETYDPPVCFYVLGNVSCLNDMCIGIVGARKASSIGTEMATKLASELANAGVTVVSGFAYGIDIAAHLGAAKSGGGTAAVLGSGFAQIYPKSHKKYIDEICRNGCIITEFDPDEAPAPYNFPKRNRVISGLSRGILVVEASPRSGSLITCRLALEQGRDVFAVPTSPLFANNATNALIKGGAILAESAADILSEYMYVLQNEYNSSDVSVSASSDSDSPEEKLIYEELSIEPLTTDELVVKTNLKFSELASLLMDMELSDKISRKDGKYCINR